MEDWKRTELAAFLWAIVHDDIRHCQIRVYLTNHYHLLLDAVPQLRFGWSLTIRLHVPIEVLDAYAEAVLFEDDWHNIPF